MLMLDQQDDPGRQSHGDENRLVTSFGVFWWGRRGDPVASAGGARPSQIKVLGHDDSGRTARLMGDLISWGLKERMS